MTGPVFKTLSFSLSKNREKAKEDLKKLQVIDQGTLDCFLSNNFLAEKVSRIYSYIKDHQVVIRANQLVLILFYFDSGKSLLYFSFPYLINRHSNSHITMHDKV